MKILYLYDEPNWAVHNVGKTWAKILGNFYEFTFVQFGKHEDYDPTNFDYVLWGHTLMQKHRVLKLWQSFFPGNSIHWKPKLYSNFIAIVHDPCEVFPTRQDWRCAEPNFNNLSPFSKIAVTSREMQYILQEAGFNCVRISTKSTLPLREQLAIEIEPLKIFVKCTGHPRKNLNLFYELQKNCSNYCAKFDAYVGLKILPEPSYTELIDGYNCYLCTSWQEGGPLPLMDAMQRGCAVLTTPVGQTDELIEDGSNGFFCRNYDEFTNRIKLLSENPNLLYEMRMFSLKVAFERDDNLLKEQLIDFLGAA